MKNLILIWVLFSVTIFAQKTSLDVAGITISFGMTKETLLNQLPDNIILKSTPDNTIFSIIKNGKSYGYVRFNNNKICRVCKYLIDDQVRNIYEIISTLYEGLNKEIGTNTFGETKTFLSSVNDADSRKKYITTSKDNWSITISVHKSGETDYVFIYEIIEATIEQIANFK